MVCNSSLRVAEPGFSPNDCGQNELNRHDHLVLLMLSCNLTCPHFLAHPNLSPVIAFPHFITRVTSSFNSGLHLLTPCPAQPSPSCSLAPFVFSAPSLYHADLSSPLLSHKAFPTSSRGTTSGSNPFPSRISLLSYTFGVFVSPALK